jgi:hypothetical protein
MMRNKTYWMFFVSFILGLFAGKFQKTENKDVLFLNKEVLIPVFLTQKPEDNEEVWLVKKNHSENPCALLSNLRYRNISNIDFVTGDLGQMKELLSIIIENSDVEVIAKKDAQTLSICKLNVKITYGPF